MADKLTSNPTHQWKEMQFFKFLISPNSGTENYLASVL